MAAKERDCPSELQQDCSRLSAGHSIKIVRAKPLMILRASVAVAACVAALLALYLSVLSCRYLYWGIAVAESAFFVYYHCAHVPYFTKLAHRQGPPEHDATFIKQRLMEQLMRVDDHMACMESWFLEAAPGEVKNDNLKELFAYAIWYKSLGEMEAEGLMPELDDLMLQLERHYNRRLPEGYNPNLRFMSHLWEPLRHIYRPLIVYVVMELLTLLCHVALLATGFRLRQLDGITYYTYRVGPQKLVPAISASMKQCRSSTSVSSAATCGSSVFGGSSSRTSLMTAGLANSTASGKSSSEADLSAMPIVFLHGVGAGLLPYLMVIFRLAALGQPMILPHSKHVSMRLVSWIPTVDDMADATAAMLSVHGFSKSAVMGHSYGTMVASRLVMKYPQLVHSMCLTDPVCFAMFMPNLLRNFLYARHKSGCWWLDLILRFVASELHCCTNFSRKFFWSSINLWDEHIPERTLVVLGGKDLLSPAAHVDRWLREHTHAQVMYEPSMRHAGMLLSMPWQAAIVSAFADIMQRPDLPDGPPAARTGDAHTSAAGAQPTGTAVEFPAAAAVAAAVLQHELSTEDSNDAEAAAADGTAVVKAVSAAGAAGSAAGGKACGLAADTVQQRSNDSGAVLRRRHSGAAGAATAVTAGMRSPLQQSCRGVQSAHSVQQQGAASAHLAHQQQGEQQRGDCASDAHMAAFAPTSPPGREAADRHELYQPLPAVAQEGAAGQQGTLLSPNKQQQQAGGVFAVPGGAGSPITAAGVAGKAALQVAA